MIRFPRALVRPLRSFSLQLRRLRFRRPVLILSERPQISDRFRLARPPAHSAWRAIATSPCCFDRCKVCRTKYNASYGIIVEALHGECGCSALAEAPPFDVGDASAMAVQQRFGRINSAAELVERLPRPPPPLLHRAMDHSPGFYHFYIPLFRELANFVWDQLSQPMKRARSGPAMAPPLAGSLADVDVVQAEPRPSVAGASVWSGRRIGPPTRDAPVGRRSHRGGLRRGAPSWEDRQGPISRCRGHC